MRVRGGRGGHRIHVCNSGQYLTTYSSPPGDNERPLKVMQVKVKSHVGKVQRSCGPESMTMWSRSKFACLKICLFHRGRSASAL